MGNENPSAKRNGILSGIRDERIFQSGGGFKPASFVKFSVIGNKRFRNYSQNSAAAYEKCAIVEISTDFDGSPDDQQQVV